MNNLENNYCKECDYNNLEINLCKYKNFKKENNKIKIINFIPNNFESLPSFYCNLCNKNNHKIDKCPLLNDNISFTDLFNKKYKSQLNKSKFNKSILKKKLVNTNDFDICYQLSNLNIKLTNKKKVKFNLTTTH